MKRILVAVLLLVLLAGLAFGQETKKPTAAVSFELFGSILALMGVNAEFFLGPVGLARSVVVVTTSDQPALLGPVPARPAGVWSPLSAAARCRPSGMVEGSVRGWQS